MELNSEAALAATTTPTINETNGLKEADKPEGFRVRSIRQMLYLFRRQIPVLFAGGQMATFDHNGNKSLVTDRKKFEAFCEQHGIFYYDPLESEPENPSFEISRFTDKTALLLSALDVCSIGNESLGGITLMELLFDAYLDANPHLLGKRIIYLPDATNKPEEAIFSPPATVFDNSPANRTIQQQYFDMAISNANLLRSELLKFATESGKIVSKQDNQPGLVMADDVAELNDLRNNPEYTCFEITNSRLHIADLIKCLTHVLDGKKVAIYFHPPVDKNNSPVMQTPEFEQATQRLSILEQFRDEGNEARTFVFDRMKQNDNTEFVYTEDALETAVLKRYERLKVDLKEASQDNVPWMAQ